MEEEDGLDMELCSTSRPVTPSPNGPPEGSGVNRTPKAKNRYHPVNPFNSPDMIDEDIPEIEGPPDEQFTIDEECAIARIRIKLEHILEELTEARGTPIWAKLNTADWARYFTNLADPTGKDNMDKHIISNLAETNAYLTKRIVKLEHVKYNIEPEIIQPQSTTPRKTPTPETPHPTPPNSPPHPHPTIPHNQAT